MIERFWFYANQRVELQETLSVNKEIGKAQLDVYDDLILSAQRCRLNKLLIWINTLMAIGLRNFLNFNLVSHRHAEHRASNEGSVLRHQARASKRTQLEAEKSESKETGDTAQWVVEEISARSLRSFRTPYLVWPFIFIETLIVLRYLFSIFRLSPSNTRIIKLSCTRNIWTTVTPVEEILASNLTRKFTRLENFSESCKSSILEFFISRYNSFIWRNVTAKITDENLERYLIFETSLGDFFPGPALTVNCLLAIFVAFCGVGATILSLYHPYEVPTFGFLLEPELSLTSYRRRFERYLKLLRLSHYNFRKYHKLCFVDKTDCDIDPNTAYDCNDLSSYLCNYRHYKPQVRSQAWRRILLLAQPILGLTTFLVSTCLVIAGFRMTHFHNSLILLRNLELKQLLLESRFQPEVEVNLQNVSSSCAGEHDDMQVLLSEALVDIISSNTKTTNYDRKSMSELDYRKYLAGLLDPLEITSWISWFLGQLGMMAMSGLLAAFYLIYSLTIFDLCFWLSEIVIKLSVCSFILEHYAEQFKHFKQHQVIVVRDYLSEDEILDAQSVIEQQKRIMGYLTYTQITERENSIDGSRSDLTSSIPIWNIYQSTNQGTLDNIRFCHEYAAQLRLLDRKSRVLCNSQMSSHKFLLTTYLDFRLFLDEIECSRTLMDYMITFAVLNSFCINFGSALVKDPFIRGLLFFLALSILNLTLLWASFFHSRCRKLHGPIHSLLAVATHVQHFLDVQHLAHLWRAVLLDFTGSRTRLCFRVYSFTLSYATTLQVSYLRSIL